MRALILGNALQYVAITSQITGIHSSYVQIFTCLHVIVKTFRSIKYCHTVHM